MPYFERLALRRSHQAQQRAPEVGLVTATALTRHAPRKSELGPDRFTTLRIIDGRATLLEQRGAVRRARLSAQLASIAVGAALIVAVVLSVLDHRGMHGCTMSREDNTKILVNQLLNEALPQFLAQHPGRTCGTWEELSEYMNTKTNRDAWNTPLYMHCLQGQRFAMQVVSAGPDRQFWTDDDIDSRSEAQ